MYKLTYTITRENGIKLRKYVVIGENDNAVSTYKVIKEGEMFSKMSPLLRSYTTSDFKIEKEV